MKAKVKLQTIKPRDWEAAVYSPACQELLMSGALFIRLIDKKNMNLDFGMRSIAGIVKSIDNKDVEFDILNTPAGNTLKKAVMAADFKLGFAGTCSEDYSDFSLRYLTFYQR